MRNQYRSRSSDRAGPHTDYNMGASRGRDSQDQHDDHSRSRHDYSRSPSRQSYYDDYPSEHPSAHRSRQDASDDRDRSGRYDEGSDDGYPRPYRSPPQSRHRDRDRSRGRGRSKNGGWDDEQQQPSYDHMYDDGHEHGRRRGHSNDSRSRGRYEDYSSRGADFAHSDRGGRSRSPRGRRYRSRSRSRTRDAGKPTDTVILEGLPYSITTMELREGLLANSVAAEFPSIDVRISSSRGKRRAFVQFDRVSQATAFIKEHFPKLHLELRDSTDDAPDGKFEAYVHFARSRGDEGDSRPPRAADWTCSQCDFSNFASRVKCKVCGAAQAVAPSWEQSLTGAADVADGADAVSQILVVHPLASFVTEDMLAKDLKLLEKTEEAKTSTNGPTKLKSTAPGADTSRYGARPNSLHRVFLTREVNSGESFKYGFAEFWTLEDAAAAVTKFRMSRSFTVAGCAVTVAPTHMGVFLPEDREITAANDHMSFHPLFNPSLRVRYRDLRVFPSQLTVTSEPPTKNANRSSTLGKSSVEDQDTEAKKQKKRKADGSLAASSSSNKRPVVMAGQMAVWQRKQDELRGDQGDKSSNGSPPEFVPRSDASKAPIKISLSSTTKLGATTSGESQPMTTAMSRGEESAPTTGTTAAAVAVAVVSSGDASTARASSITDDNTRDESRGDESNTNSNTKEETFMDRERLMCLICMRKYKSTDEVKIHEKSRNHKTAMEDDEKVKAAQPRIAARDKRLQRQAEEEGSQMPQYRDRAKERRDIYNQPDRPAAPPSASLSSSSSSLSSSKPKSEGATKPTDQAAKTGPSKGAGMLAKMGWTSGAGLGANGDGRTEVIATNAYQAGVGLGAAGGNLGDAVELAEKKTTNRYSDYLTTVQDKARERYHQLN
ncbi:hypothetical protein E4U54_004964 [Claviceps lovelessii]|nr:hypothetical protein E4U54_004964 [Claviceps lovelessii]